jgi:hypothetical protein
LATRVSSPVEIKMKAIEMKLAGSPSREIKDQLGIRNITQLKTWIRWYRAGDMHRLEQLVGKQITKQCKCTSKYTLISSSFYIPLKYTMLSKRGKSCLYVEFLLGTRIWDTM